MIDWAKAPAWANYHAFDGNAQGIWHEKEPKVNHQFACWMSNGNSYPSLLHPDRRVFFIYSRSLEERPKEN